MIRKDAEEAVMRAGRWVKRRLGLGGAVAAQPPRRPGYFEAGDASAAYSQDGRRGALVFVLEYVSRGAGGLADVLHLGAALERDHGLAVSYLAVGGQPWDLCWENLHWTDPQARREQLLASLDFSPEFLCATSWPTAFEVLRRPSGRKLYFVQDYEPWFHRAGMDQHAAARTYRLGLEMFTLGPWLAGHIRAVHGVECAGFMPFPATDSADPGRPLAERSAITFFVQPDKPQRGSEMLLEGARRLSRKLEGRGFELVIFGSADNEYLKLDFPCRLLGVVGERELRSLLRSTRVGVCASFTNVSLMTFRFLAHGCLTLDLDLPNVTEDVPSCVEPLFRAYEPDPDVLVHRSEEAWDRRVADDRRQDAVETLCREHSWTVCADAVARVLRKEG